MSENIKQIFNDKLSKLVKEFNFHLDSFKSLNELNLNEKDFHITSNASELICFHCEGSGKSMTLGKNLYLTDPCWHCKATGIHSIRLTFMVEPLKK
jgi:hypothetical protein